MAVLKINHMEKESRLEKQIQELKLNVIYYSSSKI